MYFKEVEKSASNFIQNHIKLFCKETAASIVQFYFNNFFNSLYVSIIIIIIIIIIIVYFYISMLTVTLTVTPVHREIGVQKG